jgi:hypothetical protein
MPLATQIAKIFFVELARVATCVFGAVRRISDVV